MSAKTDKRAAKAAALKSAVKTPARSSPSDQTLPDVQSEAKHQETMSESPVNADILLAADDWELRLAKAREQRKLVLATKSAEPQPAPADRLTPQPKRSGPEAKAKLAPKATPKARTAKPKKPTPVWDDDAIDASRNVIKTKLAALNAPANIEKSMAHSDMAPAPRRPMSLASAGVLGIGIGLGIGMVLMSGLNGFFGRDQVASSDNQPQPVVALAPLPHVPDHSGTLFDSEATAPEREMVVSRASIAPMLEPVRARVLPAPEVTYDLATTQQLIFDVTALTKATNGLASFASNDTQVQLASAAAAPIITALKPTAYEVQSQALPFDLSASQFAVDLLPAVFADPKLPILTHFETEEVSTARATPGLVLDGVIAAKAIDQLPVFESAPRVIRAVTQTPSLVDPDTLTFTASVDRPRALNAMSRASVAIPAAFAPQQDTLPSVGAPPERAPTLAQTLGLIGDRAEDVRLFVHAPASVQDEALQAELSTYEGTGFAIAKVNRENFKISNTHIRYYTRADEKYAQALAANLGVRARDFVRSGGESGRIEIWMEGRGTNRVAATPQRATTQRRAQPVDPALQLRNSLVQKLRRGDHL